MNKEKINIAIVGLGNVTNHMHLPAIESLKEYNIFGMYDINKNLRRELSIKYNCKCYLSFDDICNDKNVDLILITTPTRTHYILFKKAAESKKNIIIEKPHATNSLESEEMSKIVKKNNIKTAIVFQRNYSISTEIIKELFSLDDFRKPVIVFGYFWINIAKFFQSDNWRFKKKMGGGAILDLLPHILANLMIFLNFKVKRLNAFTKNLKKTYITNDTEEVAIINMELENGILVQLNIGYFGTEILSKFNFLYEDKVIDYDFTNSEVNIFSKKEIKLSNLKEKFNGLNIEKVNSKTKIFHNNILTDVEMLKKLYFYFYQSIIEDKEIYFNIHKGHEMIKIMDAIRNNRAIN